MTDYTDYLYRLDLLDSRRLDPTADAPVHVTMRAFVNGYETGPLAVYDFAITGEPYQAARDHVGETRVRLTVDASAVELDLDPETGNLRRPHDPANPPRVHGLQVLVPLDRDEAGQEVLPPIDFSEDGERVTLTIFVGEIHLMGGRLDAS